MLAFSANSFGLFYQMPQENWKEFLGRPDSCVPTYLQGEPEPVFNSEEHAYNLINFFGSDHLESTIFKIID